jgi:class 3 adenylate cyclase
VQPRGDGELAVLPTDTDVAWVVARYTQLLVEGLREDAPALPHFRLRIAMHHGPLTAGRLGPVGDAPIVACRLLDSSPVKKALATNASTDLVLVISRQLFTDVVLTRFHGLSPDRFRPIPLFARIV